MTANVDAMVRAGVEAYRAGNRAEARTLLERAIEFDGYNEVAWLWLSAVVDTPAEQQTCLENVLVINPNNERAKQGLRSLGVDPDAVIQASQEEEPPASASAFVEDDYQVPSSSASIVGSEPELTSDQYDDWVEGLNISSDDVPSGSSVFSDDDFSASDTFQLDEDFFTEDDLFADAGYEAYEDDYDDTYDTGYSDTADAMYADAGTLDEFSSAMDTSDDYDSGIFDERYDDPVGDSTFADEDMAYDDYDEPVAGNQESSTDMYALFAAIPPEIEPGRMPGENERVSPIHYVMVSVLVLVNLGALGFIALTMLG